ncbi:hypothetical protein ATEIFO6365_0007033900 [Aspergillus terreus]|uniref:Uncharacterized protein n=1 Tax=Aspergillus terreus TaxID=33178 RepID=A0A5M3Z8R8_ASPTE|nr:hypothetical protein ATETN484_0009033900 [Aspergillus terreus]GFF17790.1 hypothetical protein ATEIFO6365_0007033900 [Aspergillus terreus]
MGSSKESGRPSDDLPLSVESSDCEMEENGDRKSDVELADGDAPECDNSTEPSTPCKSSKTAPPETPDSGYYDGEGSPLGASGKLSPPKTLIGVIGDICDQIRKPFSKADRKGPGFAYVFYDPSDDGDMYKIGQSIRVPKRENYYKNKCQIEGWEMTSRPRIEAIWGHERLEKLAQKQLGNFNFKFDCFCRTKHEEFFMGNKEAALAVLEIWTKWLWQRPYDDDGNLKPFWEDRLKLLEPMYFSAFNCGKHDCPSRGESAPACQECLMEGWKAWTTATITDKPGLFTNGVVSASKPVSQAQFPWPMVFWRAFLFLCFLYVPVLGAGNIYLVSCLLEGGLALGFYPAPQLRTQETISESAVHQMLSPLGKALQLGNAGIVNQKKHSPKGKQPVAHNTSPLETPSRSLSRIRSPPPMDASPPSPSVEAARRKQGSPKSAPRQTSPSPGVSIPSESSHKDETPASWPYEVDGSGRKLRRSDRQKAIRMRNMGTT